MKKEPKIKKCANEECENTFRQFNSLQKYCGSACAKKCHIEKDRKLIRESKNFDDLQFQFDVRRKSLAVLEADAKREFQKWIRWRDRAESCISCGTINAIEWHGGHCFKAEIYSGIILDEMNVHKQCRNCNIGLDGNHNSFIKGLIIRYGDIYLSTLEAKAISTRAKKWSREDLIEIKAKYQRLNNQAQREL